jgi:hypothetical protein
MHEAECYKSSGPKYSINMHTHFSGQIKVRLSFLLHMLICYGVFYARANNIIVVFQINELY